MAVTFSASSERASLRAVLLVLVCLLAISCRRSDAARGARIGASAATAQSGSTSGQGRGVAPPVDETYQAFRVSGGVEAPIVIARGEPDIPPNTPCRGFVQFHCVIDEQGYVTRIEDLSPQHDAFSRAYQEALRKTRFRPGTLHGKPVPVEYTMSVNIRCQPDS